MNNQNAKIHEIKDLINVVKEQDKEYKKIQGKKIYNIIVIVFTILTIVFTIAAFKKIERDSMYRCGGQTDALGNTM